MAFAGDPRYLRLPPELKQECGDGIIMMSDNDTDLCHQLLSIILDVGKLDDDCPPNVVPWDDACSWVQNVIDNLTISLDYYTLIFCIITEELLQSRHFADSALLAILEEKKETFIPVFRNKEEFERMKKSREADKKLPGVYRIMRPIFLESTDSERGRTRLVRQLKKLFNHHLHTKLQRSDKNDKRIQQAMDEMDPVRIKNPIDLDMGSDKMSNLSSEFDLSSIEPPSVSPEVLEPQLSISVPPPDGAARDDETKQEETPQTDILVRQRPTATLNLGDLTRDLSVDGEEVSLVDGQVMTVTGGDDQRINLCLCENQEPGTTAEKLESNNLNDISDKVGSPCADDPIVDIVDKDTVVFKSKHAEESTKDGHQCESVGASHWNTETVVGASILGATIVGSMALAIKKYSS